ncbi:MAG: biopolymer transporter ExbD [Bacteroidota bacterium]
MNKFSRKSGKGMAKISTASLPDIVFMMLFFFMVTATIKSEKKLVDPQEPHASEISKPDKKILVKELIIGRPLQTDAGLEYKLVADDQFISMGQLKQWVTAKRDELPEYYKDQLIIMLRADKSVKMGMISDVQQELRDSNARKVLYRALDE